MYGRKIGSDFSKEMTRSIKVMLENWKEKWFSNLILIFS
jgi:hypothetical protein